MAELSQILVGATNFTNTDTKNTAGSTDTSSKIFLIGATSQAANPQTYSQDTAYVGTDGCLYSGGTKVLTAHQDISGKADKSATVSTVTWDSTNKKLTKTINGTTTDVVTGDTILSGLTKSQVITALGYTPPTSDTNTHRPIQLNGTEILGNNTTALNLKAGNNISITNSSGTVTIAATGGDTSNCMMKGVDYVTAGQASGSILGTKATAEGQDVIAFGDYSHAEGEGTYARGVSTHAEGTYTTARGNDSHAEGLRTHARSDYSHAEGSSTTAYGECAHAEGYLTNANGDYSHAEGSITTAYGNNSHAEGSGTYATSEAAHAEGFETTASAGLAHAEGNSTRASGSASHAEGASTTASGYASHAEGAMTYASINYSHASGYCTSATNYTSFAIGHYNAAMTTGGSSSNKTGTAFVIGNGTRASSLSNAFSVQYDGTVKAASTITASTTADYAEFFEWSDENPNAEDRVGHFVTFDSGNKVRIATSDDDYILGVVSGEPFVLGNGDCDVWNGMVMRDKFRRVIYEPAPLYEIDPETREEVPVLDDEGNQVYQGMRPIYNPDYDPSKPYISRMDRPEWAAIGMLGVLAVIDDGTCEVNGYCTVNANGVATKAKYGDKNSYRIIKRNDIDVIEIVFK